MHWPKRKFNTICWLLCFIQTPTSLKSDDDPESWWWAGGIPMKMRILILNPDNDSESWFWILNPDDDDVYEATPFSFGGGRWVAPKITPPSLKLNCSKAHHQLPISALDVTFHPLPGCETIADVLPNKSLGRDVNTDTDTNPLLKGKQGWCWWVIFFKANVGKIMP